MRRPATARSRPKKPKSPTNGDSAERRAENYLPRRRYRCERALLLTMRGHVDPISRVEPDLVAQGADGDPEHASRAGAISVAARKRLQHQLPLDLTDGGSDQQRDDLM